MTYRIQNAFLAFLVAFALTAPAAFAETNGDKNKNKERDNKKTERTCLKAWGHLIAPGWIRVKGQATSTLDGNCILPFGISKKFRGASTTPDITAPVIANVVIEPRSTEAVVTWTTNERSDGTVFWGTSPSLDAQSTTTARVSHGSKVRDHRIALTGLTASTTYYAVVGSRDAAGNVSYSSEMSFKTLASNDTTAPTVSSIVAVVGTSTVTVGWKTNEPATSKVFYSTTTPVNIGATTTASVGSSALVTEHALQVTNLATSTQHYFVIQSKDASGNTTTSAEFGATTGM